MARGIALTLADEADIECVGVARTAAETVRLAQERHADVLLADFHLPDRSGAELVRELLASGRVRRAVVLSGDDSEDTLLEAVNAGASGFLVKTEPGEEIGRALRRVADGEMLVPAETLRALLVRQAARSDRRAELERLQKDLTARERDVLRLIADGLDNRAVAERLGVSVNTVRGYAQGLLEKLGAHSKLEAVVIAGRIGLLDL